MNARDERLVLAAENKGSGVQQIHTACSIRTDDQLRKESY